MTYNDLLIKILDLTPEQRKKEVKITYDSIYLEEESCTVGKMFIACDTPYIIRN